MDSMAYSVEWGSFWSAVVVGYTPYLQMAAYRDGLCLAQGKRVSQPPSIELNRGTSVPKADRSKLTRYLVRTGGVGVVSGTSREQTIAQIARVTCITQ
jgi:hypothetical protein